MKLASALLDEEERAKEIRAAVNDAALDKFLADPRVPVFVIDRTVVRGADC